MEERQSVGDDVADDEREKVRDEEAHAGKEAGTSCHRSMNRMNRIPL